MKTPSQIALGFLFSACLFAQNERASISGIVSDPSGAAIAGAGIVARNLATSIETGSVTNSSGNYYLSLPPGDYSVTISRQGFSTSVVPKLTLTVAQNAAVSLALSVSSVQQQVTVSAASALLDQESASLGTAIESEKISQLPILGRNPYSLVVLAPGVNPKGNPGTGPLINGGRSNANSVLLDGGQMLNSTTNDTAYTPPLEAVEQFRVQTSSFQAEFGRTGGGVLNVTTKMGTNKWHGSAYEYFRNNALNANTYSNDLVGLSKAVVRHNEFGGTFGGPVRLPKLYNGTDRTFFFVAWEGVPDRSPQSTIATVPTVAQRSGDFSQTFGANSKPILIYDPYTSTLSPGSTTQYVRTPFPNNAIPISRINPVAANILGYFPNPDSPGLPIVATDNFVRNGDAVSDADRLLIRIDHALSARNRLFTRFGVNTNNTTSTAVVNAAFPQQTSTAYEPITEFNASVIAGDTVTFTPNLIGEFRIGYTRDHKNSVPSSNGFNLSQLGFSPQVAAIARAGIFPGIDITGDDLLGTATTALRLSVQENRQASGTITWIKNRHTIKMGGDLEIFRNDTYSPTSPTGSFSFAPTYTQGSNPTTASANDGLGLATFLLGLPTSGSLTLDPSLATQQIYVGGFAQDTFKITSRLTLDFGLRYEVTTPWEDRFNQLAYFNPAAPDSTTGRPGAIEFVNSNHRGQSNPNLKDFGPRAGIAWLVAPRTTLRAGCGMFFAQGNRGIGAVSSELGQGFQTSTSVYLGPANTNAYLPPVGATLANPFVTGFLIPPSNLVGGTVTTTLNNTPNPVSNQWTASLQRQVTGNLMLEAGYTGNRGEHLWAEDPFDAANPIYLALGNALTQQVPNPFYGQIATGTLSAKTITLKQSLEPYPQYTTITLHDQPFGDSIYHALVLKADKRFSHGFTVLGSYTFGKEIDDVGEHFSGRTSVSDPYNLRQNRSVADYDVPQRLVVTYIWQLPLGPGQAHFHSGLLATIVGAWQANGIASFQRGMPIVITGPNTADISGLTSRANRISSGILASGQTANQWFNTAAFVSAAAFSLGSDSRTEPALRAPGIHNFDFSLMRNQSIREHYNVQFRAEAFNIFNSPQLSAPDSTVTSPTFGRILAGTGNRALQLGLRISF